MKYKEYELPDELLYNKDSSWVKVEGDVFVIGIIEPVAKVLKEFLFVKLPDMKKIKSGETYVSLETLKWSGHFSSPLSGDIIEVNEDLYDEPGRINEDPYGAWIVKMKITDKEELKNLCKPNEIVDWLDKVMKGGN